MNYPAIIANKIKSVKLPIPKTFSVKLEKHAPDIMIVGGIVMIVGSAVYACKQTFEARDILEKTNSRLDDIAYGESVADDDPDYNVKIARKERMLAYRDMGFDLAKCYGPSIIFGVTGIALILGAHKIEKDRNAALGVAYANLLASYNSYRDRVREEIGEEKELLIRSGAVKEKIPDESGDGKKQKNAIVFHDDGSSHSPYARIFAEESSDNWNESPQKNLIFLKNVQNYANDKLQTEGVVFLNDIYHALGFPRTPEGQLVGWVWDPRHEDYPDHIGDNYIDFGIFDKAKTSAVVRDFINGYESCIWLDFNVDGVVYDLI